MAEIGEETTSRWPNWSGEPRDTIVREVFGKDGNSAGEQRTPSHQDGLFGTRHTKFGRNPLTGEWSPYKGEVDHAWTVVKVSAIGIALLALGSCVGGMFINGSGGQGPDRTGRSSQNRGPEGNFLGGVVKTLGSLMPDNKPLFTGAYFDGSNLCNMGFVSNVEYNMDGEYDGKKGILHNGTWWREVQRKSCPPKVNNPNDWGAQEQFQEPAQQYIYPHNRPGAAEMAAAQMASQPSQEFAGCSYTAGGVTRTVYRGGNLGFLEQGAPSGEVYSMTPENARYLCGESPLSQTFNPLGILALSTLAGSAGIFGKREAQRAAKTQNTRKSMPFKRSQHR